MKLLEIPEIQSFNLSEVKHISVKNAYELISEDKIHFLDIREQDEVMCEYFEFKNIFLFPMSQIMEKLDHLPKNIDIVVVSEDGINSTKIVNMLQRQAYLNVVNLDGGIKEWKNKNLPIVETGFRKDSTECNTSTCGCSCCGCN